jgi:hypothetical protein
MSPDEKTHKQIDHILVDRRRHSNVLYVGSFRAAKESLGYFELKKHKPWFDEGCSILSDQSKQTKLQWIQDPSEINGSNLNNVRREANRYFRREYLKNKINELATNSKNKNIRDLYRGMSEFKRGYHPRNNLVKDENSDFLADSHNILSRLKIYFLSY